MKTSVDHVHVFVSDQYEAASWYEKVLGLAIVAEHKDWAVGGGPLTISGDGGSSGIALFARPSEKSVNQSTVAFGVGGEEFVGFVERCGALGVSNREGSPLSASDVSDHEKSWSVYFSDPYGNPIEVTTYDYVHVKERLSRP